MKTQDREIVERALQNLAKHTPMNNGVFDSDMPDLYDFKIRIHNAEFAGLIRNSINSANALSVIERAKDVATQAGLPVLIITSRLFPKLMKVFNENGICIMDKAGNADISHGYMAICIVGNKAEDEIKPIKQLGEAGISLVMYLLMDKENVRKSYREIQAATVISLGTIKKTFGILKAKHFLLETENGRSIIKRDELIDWWQEEYNTTLKPRLLLRRMGFRDDVSRSAWKEMILPAGMYWGGDCAANLVDGYLVPGMDYEIYTDVATPHLLQTGKVKMDDRGEIRLYRKFWKFSNEGFVIPNVLIYADLMGSGNSRCYEVAQRLKEYGI